jgi:hypothetical protein
MRVACAPVFAMKLKVNETVIARKTAEKNGSGGGSQSDNQ